MKTKKPGTDSPTQPTVSSKLMENYLVAKAIDAQQQIVTFENGDGELELFTIGSDGNIYNVRRTKKGDTTFAVSDTGVQATQIAGGLDPDGNRIVFGVSNGGVVFAVADAAGNTWASAQLTDWRYNNASRVYYRAIGGEFVLGVIVPMTFTATPGPFAWLNVAAWQNTTDQDNWLWNQVVELDPQILLSSTDSQAFLTALITPQLAFYTTTEFESNVLYDDHGGGGPMDIAFWRPVYPSPYGSMGDYAQTNYESPSGSMVGIAALDGPGQQPLLSLPVQPPGQSYSEIYMDQGSNAYLDGSIWWPNAPDGYVAMGCVVNGADNSSGYDMPASDLVSCIRQDFVADGGFGGLLWNNNVKPGMEVVSCYSIAPPTNGTGQGTGAFWAQPNQSGQPSGTVFVPSSIPGSAFVFTTDPAANNLAELSINAPFSVIASAAVDTSYTPAAGIPELFIIQNNGRIYYLDQGTPAWVQIPSVNDALTFVGIAAAITGDNETLMVFGLTANGQLYQSSHSTSTSKSPSDWTTFGSIAEDVAQFATGTDSSGIPQVFMVTNDGKLLRLWQEGGRGDWQKEQVAVAATGKIREIRSYSTEITVLDDGGSPAPFKKAAIWASGPAAAIVNGVAQQIDQNVRAEVTTNASGMIVIDVAAEDLATVTIKLHTELMPEGSSFEIDANATIKAKLAAITPDQLADAKDKRTRQPLLDGKTRSSASALQHLADSLNHVASLTIDPPPAEASRAAGVRPSPNRHVWYTAEDVGHFHDQVPAHRLRTQSFMIARGPFETVMFTAPAPELAPPESVLSDISWGDFWSSVWNKLIKITHFVVDKGWLVIKTAADQVYKFALTRYQQVFDVLQEIFRWVEVEVGRVIDWLADLFDWEDILRTHTVIRHALEEMFPFLSSLISELENKIDDKIDGLELKLDAWFEKLAMQIGGQTMAQTTNAAPAQPALGVSNDHNLVMNGFVNHADQGSTPALALLPGVDPQATAIWSQILSAVENELSTIRGDDGFMKAVDAIKRIVTRPDELPQLLLTSVLDAFKSLARFMLEIGRVSIDLFLQALELLIDHVHGWLTASIDIPFLTPLYKKLTGNDMSLADVASLIIALPVTPLFKLLHKGVAPFPDASSVEEFKTTFTASWLLSLFQDSSVAGSSGRKIPASLENWRRIVPSLGALSLMIRAGLDAVADSFLPSMFSKPTKLPLGEPHWTISLALIGSEILVQLVRLPWWLKDDLHTPVTHAEVAQWLIAGWLMPVTDVVAFGALAAAKKNPKTMRNINDATFAVVTFIGLIQEVWGVVFVVEHASELTSTEIAEKFVEPGPLVFEFLRSSWLGEEALLFTVPGLLVGDAVFGVATALLFGWNASGHEESRRVQMAAAV